MLRTTIATIIGILMMLPLLNAQETVKLKNPSFEGEPARGIINPLEGTRSPNIKGWLDCSEIFFPQTSPPDLHGSNSELWGIEDVEPLDGKTFLGMVVREDESFESVSQNLDSPLSKGITYEFSINLCSALTYRSATQRSRNQEKNFDRATVLRIYGGQSACDSRFKLYESPPIDHLEWSEYKFTFEAPEDISTIILQAYFVTPTPFGYNGHILIDQASDFIPVNDGEEIMASVEPEVEKEKIHSSSAALNDIKESDSKIAQQLLLNYYNEGKSYGLYRFTRDLSLPTFDLLTSILKTAGLSTQHLERAKQLCETITENGHSAETQKEIKYLIYTQNGRKKSKHT